MKKFKLAVPVSVVALVLMISVNVTTVFALTITEQMNAALKGVSLPSVGEGASVDTNTQTIIGNTINIFLGLFGMLFLSLMIYGGYRWMNARGNESELDSAKAIIRSAIIGFVIVMTAYAVSTFVAGALQALNTK